MNLSGGITITLWVYDLLVPPRSEDTSSRPTTGKARSLANTIQKLEPTDQNIYIYILNE